MSEKFNPSSPEYKQVKDLPQEHQEKFVDIPEEEGGGFVMKSARDYSLEARIEEIVKNDPTALERKLNMLHQEALQIENSREALLKRIEGSGGFALKYASPELQNDREFVMKAIERNGEALAYADLRFQNDLEFLLEVAKINPKALAYAPIDVRERLGIE